MPDLEETMKDWLMWLECKYGAGDPRSVALRQQIEGRIRERLENRPKATAEQVKADIDLLWGE